MFKEISYLIYKVSSYRISIEGYEYIEYNTSIINILNQNTGSQCRFGIVLDPPAKKYAEVELKRAGQFR
jgi:hypothetical protein